MQIPCVQTYAAGKVSTMLSDALDADIRIGKVYYSFFNKVVVNDILVAAPTPMGYNDTLLQCRTAYVSINPRSLAKGELDFGRIILENGQFNLVTEGDNASNLSRIFRLNPDAGKKSGSAPLKLKADEVKLSGFGFQLVNRTVPIHRINPPYHIDFTDLDIDDIEIRISDVRMEDNVLTATIRRLEGTDKSGYRIEEMRGDVTVSGTEATVRNLFIRDNFSTVRANYYTMRYAGAESFQDYVNEVEMEADLTGTELNMKTVGKIVPELKDCDIDFILNGKVKGPVRDLRISNMHASVGTGLTSIIVDTRIKGLPDVSRTTFNARIRQSAFTAYDLNSIVREFGTGTDIAFIRDMTPGALYSFKGGINGLITDFAAHGNLRSIYGNIHADILINAAEPQNGTVLSGSIRAEDIAAGTLSGNDLLGDLTFDADATVNLGNEDGISADIHSFGIEKLELNGYTYSGISAMGHVDRNRINGIVKSTDRNMDFEIKGIAFLSDSGTSEFDIFADLNSMNFAATNIDTRDSISLMKAKITANFTQNIKNDILGKITVSGLTYENTYKLYSVDDITYSAQNAGKDFSITVRSPFLDADYLSNAPISSFVSDFRNRILHEALPSLVTKDGNATEGEHRYTIDVRTKNMTPLLEVIMPSLRIARNSSVHMETGDGGSDRIRILSDSISLGNNGIVNIRTNVIKDSMMSIMVYCDDIFSGKVHFRNSFLRSSVDNDKVTLNLSFDNGQDEKSYESKGNLSLSSLIGRDSITGRNTLLVNFDDSEIVFKNDTWKIPVSSLFITDSLAEIKGFRLMNLQNSQNLMIDGRFSSDSRDTMKLRINNLDITPVNLFTGGDFDFEGRLTADAVISGNGNSPHITADVTLDSLSIRGINAGRLNFSSSWSDSTKVFDIYAATELNGRIPLSLKGHYSPSGKNVSINAKLDSLEAGYFEPLLSEIVSDMSGTASGHFTLEGPIGMLKLRSDDAHLENAGFKVVFTQVPYVLNGPVMIDEYSIRMENVEISDRFGNRGRVNGGILHDHFADLRLNTNITLRNMECLNTTEKDNPTFYGNVFGSGVLNITGPINDILLDTRVTTEQNSSLHIPLSSSSEAQSGKILNFVEFSTIHENDGTYVLVKNPKRIESEQSNLRFMMEANINPTAEIQIEINKSLGDILKVTGNGLVNMDVDPSENRFDMFGDYTINSGSYRFVILGITSKDFTIQQGGQIIFNGDIMQTSLDATASYRTKATLNTLISDISSVSNRRNVDCEIHLGGTLANPQPSFDISIPDLDPTTKARAEDALSTQDKKQKQFVSLIVSGNFVPDEQSAIVNNSLLYSNASEAISTQINNIFRQLDLPIDLGFNYQPGQERGQDIFDVAVSTQLFNNRVIVNGNIGNGRYNNVNSVVGDIDIEIKLEKKGKLRLNLFSHSADQYSNYLDDSQRQGVGIVYQEEFNSFKELFRQLFWSRKRKAEYRRMQYEKIISDKRIKANAVPAQENAE